MSCSKAILRGDFITKSKIYIKKRKVSKNNLTYKELEKQLSPELACVIKMRQRIEQMGTWEKIGETEANIFLKEDKQNWQIFN